MNIKRRRVVTGHDETGRAIVLFDGLAENITSGRPGQERALLWMTDTLPVRNEGDEDLGGRHGIGPGVKGGTVFGVVRIEPGCDAMVHRTETIDYGVILSGTIVLEMDGTEVTLNAGDTYVLRGTIHSWDNRGTEACELAVAMTDAYPVEVGGRVLGTHF
jgi:quercetin dioxygenase-like cupin family protein